MFCFGFHVARDLHVQGIFSGIVSRRERKQSGCITPHDGNSGSKESSQEAMMCFEDDGRRIRTACSRRGNQCPRGHGVS